MHHFFHVRFLCLGVNVIYVLLKDDGKKMVIASFWRITFYKFTVSEVLNILIPLKMQCFAVYSA